MADENTLQFGEEFDKQGFELIEPGVYEVLIDKIEPRTSKTGKKYLNVTFKIRDDVEQKSKNRKLFYSIFQRDGDACYDFPKVNKLILTQKDTKNYKSRFLDFDEVLLYLNGIHLSLTVETCFDEYYGEDRNRVKDWSFEPSAWDKGDHSPKTIEVKEQGPVDPASKIPAFLTEDADDLPF